MVYDHDFRILIKVSPTISVNLSAHQLNGEVTPALITTVYSEAVRKVRRCLIVMIYFLQFAIVIGT
jgi:hypothetical protein